MIPMSKETPRYHPNRNGYMSASVDGDYIRHVDHNAAMASKQSEIDSLRAKVEALTKDKDRLDYLDQANARLNAHFKTVYRWELIMNHNVNRLMLPGFAVDLNDARANGLPSCRDAIDQRMHQSESLSTLTTS